MSPSSRSGPSLATRKKGTRDLVSSAIIRHDPCLGNTDVANCVAQDNAIVNRYGFNSDGQQVRDTFGRPCRPSDRRCIIRRYENGSNDFLTSCPG